MSLRELVVPVAHGNQMLGVASVSRQPTGDYSVTWHPAEGGEAAERLRAATLLRWLADGLEIEAIATTEDTASLGEAARDS